MKRGREPTLEERERERERGKQEVSKVKETGGPMSVAEGKPASAIDASQPARKNLILISNEDPEPDRNLAVSLFLLRASFPDPPPKKSRRSQRQSGMTDDEPSIQKTDLVSDQNPGPESCVSVRDEEEEKEKERE